MPAVTTGKGAVRAPDASGSGYIPALDGLRALAILLVVFSHIVSSYIPGGFGVTLFFFISGYIISANLLDEFERQGTLDIRAFYIRRFFRLSPALYAFVILAFVGFSLLGHPLTPWDGLSSALYYSNYWQIYHGFTSGVAYPPFSITWSLAIEGHFYLLYPVLLLWLLRRRLSGPWVVFMGIAVFVLLWRYWLVAGSGPEGLPRYRIYMGTDTRLDSLVYGVLFALLYRSCAGFRRVAHAWPGLVAGVLLLMFTLLYRDAVFRETLRYSLQGVGIALIFAHCALRSGGLGALFAQPSLVYIGKISYSLYLYHWLVICVADYLERSRGIAVPAAVQILLALVLAHLSWRYIERLGQIGRRHWMRLRTVS